VPALFERVTESEVKPGGNGTYPARVVLSRVPGPTYPEMPYCTHVEVLPVGEGHGPFLVWGHYDMTLEQAEADLEERARRL